MSPILRGVLLIIAAFFALIGVLAAVAGEFGMMALEAFIAVAIALVAMRLGRPMEVDLQQPPRADRRPPVAPIAEADLVDVPEPVTACPDCGFLGIRMLGIQDGTIPGAAEIGDKRTCPRCGYQGLAVEFSTRSEYGAFLRDLAGEPGRSG
jgi:hypothetical protein